MGCDMFLLGIMRVLCLFALVRTCFGAWYFRENAVCDPSRSNVLPFTGFRINRIFKLQGLGVPVSQNFLRISHCDHGKVDYDKTMKIGNSIDINWDRPFCMLKPELSPRLWSQDTVSQYKNQVTVYNEDNSTNGSKSDSPAGFFQFPGLRKKIDYVVEKLTDGTLIQYSGKASVDHLEDIKQTNPQSSMVWESRNLVCYKIARRQKYAKRNITFYVPNTFVGGLFECPVPFETRQKLLQNLNSGDLIKPLDFHCDDSIAKPILPLVAADSTKRWFQYDLLRNPLNPAIIQTIPYLTTTTPFNFRFSAMESSDMYKDSWASKIDVNEDYSYTEVDLNLLSKAMTLSADYLNKLISPIQILPMLSQFNLGLQQLGSPDRLLELDFQNLDLDQRAGLFLSYKNKNYVKHHLTVLQKLWDDIVKDN